eukprot:CAMPEP_0201512090 /NCGR_PEP_ID=MMETSP0161_2-20130828/4428_1 /ASSEMBLY_ACC=CAM_ASM_000251 /TAXON_ID=180227 /ORGANISM="Neoparamoeba aestuarina, Strain SoJaBio B1-5/56/2" /LENGTH=172 /DNA_ID=CAMNT_0047907813 /DNA_START=670 /DNA_END=1188 /DNA_ORIENTATION=+
MVFVTSFDIYLHFGDCCQHKAFVIPTKSVVSIRKIQQEQQETEEGEEEGEEEEEWEEEGGAEGGFGAALVFGGEGEGGEGEEEEIEIFFATREGLDCFVGVMSMRQRLERAMSSVAQQRQQLFSRKSDESLAARDKELESCINEYSKEIEQLREKNEMLHQQIEKMKDEMAH